MYRALYRKWRPMTFEDVVGQENITSALKSQIAHDKIGHAYIFTGTRGTGKTTCAKIFAKAINCTNPHEGDPCCECDVCKGITNGSILDVVEMDAASNNGVDNIRDLREETAYTPSVCRYKVYIIDEVHMLSGNAFNALLKIMEEPPSHVVFILATTEINKVPATILSRCQRYDFTRIPVQKIAERVQFVAKSEKIELSEDAAQLIARLADGALRDALSILDTCASVANTVDEALVRRMAGVTDKEYLFKLSDALHAKDTAAALLLVAQLREQSIDVRRLCTELIAHYRNLMIAKVPGASEELLSSVSAGEEQKYIAAEIQQPEAVHAITVLGEALDNMRKGTDQRVEMELALVALCSETPLTVQTMVAPVAEAAAPAPTRSYVAPEPTLRAAPAQEAPKATPPYIQTTPGPVIMQTPPAEEEPAPAASTVPAVNTAPAAPQIDFSAQTGEIFAGWQQVTELVKKTNRPLYATLEGSKAYFDGKRVLIDGNDLFLSQVRSSEIAKTTLKNAIFEVTGYHYAIGPYEKKKAAQQQKTAMNALQELQDKGIPVTIKE